MKRLLRASLLAVSLLLAATMPVLAYLYRAPVSVSENASVSYGMLPVMWNQNNVWLSGNGFQNASANNTRVQTLAGLNKKWMVADNKTLTALPVAANSQTNLYYVTGEAEASAMDIILGRGGYVTTLDAPLLEWSNNGTATLNGWIDTANGTDKRLIGKDDAIDIFVSPTVSGNITATMGFVPRYWRARLTNAGSGIHYDEMVVRNATTNLTLTTGVISTGGLNGWNAAQLIDGNIATSGFDDSAGTIVGEWVQIDFGSGNETLVRGWSFYVDGVTTAIFAIDISSNGADWSPIATGFSCAGGAGWKFVNFGNAYATSSITGVTTAEHTVKAMVNDNLLGIGVDLSSTNATLPISTNLTFNVPLWQTDLNTSPFVSKDNNAHSCTVTEAVWSSLGYTFDGVNDLITAPTLTITNNVTVMGWFKHLGGNASIANSHMIGWTNCRLYQPVLNDPNGLQFYLNPSGGAKFFGFVGESVNVWHHFALTYDGVNGILYSDGAAGASQAATGTIAGGLFYIGGGLTGQTNILVGEVQVYDKAFSATEVAQNYQYTKWKYDGSTGSMNYNATGGASVPGIATNWEFMLNNSVPYANLISMSVAGSQKLLYQPSSMILTTVLPNELNPGTYNGAITWGSNPSGVTVTLGSMTSTGQSIIGGTDTGTTDVLPPVGGSDWNVEPDVSGTLITNPLRPLIKVVSDNTSLSERQTWVWAGTALWVMVLVVSARALKGHFGIAAIAAGVAIVVDVVLTIYPIGMLAAAVLFILGGLVSERTPSL